MGSSEKPFRKDAFKYCFCEIPEAELFRLAREKFIENRPTEEMMKEARSDREKGYIATIALMDVNESVLEKFIIDGERDIVHVFACRDRVVAVLKEHGIECRRGICKTKDKDNGNR